MLKLTSAIFLIGTLLGGCTELACGDGTHEEDGKCVPNIPLKCGDGTRLNRGWCVVVDAGSTADTTEDREITEDNGR